MLARAGEAQGSAAAGGAASDRPHSQRGGRRRLPTSARPACGSARGTTAVYVGHTARRPIRRRADGARRRARSATMPHSCSSGRTLLEDDATSTHSGVGVVLLGPRSPDELDRLPAARRRAHRAPHRRRLHRQPRPDQAVRVQAVGRPVVSTAVAGFRESNSPLMSITDTAEFGTTVGTGASPTFRGQPAAHRRMDRQSLAMRKTFGG